GQGAGEVGLAAEAAIEVLTLDRPLRREERFDARDDGPAGVPLAVRRGHAERGKRALVVDPGVAAGAVEQDLVDGVADTAAHGAHRVSLRAERRGHNTEARDGDRAGR